jgi:hypothetical protein
MGRRELIVLFAGAATVWSLVAAAQHTAKVPRTGVLNPGPSDSPTIGAFYEGLHELGYIEGQNIVIERCRRPTAFGKLWSQ